MKVNYALIREGRVLVESDDLDYIKSMKEELAYRQTGRTTRMLFQALSDPAKEVVIVAWNRHQRQYLMDRILDILNALNFEYTSNTADGTIINFGKTYHFVTKDYMESIHCKFHGQSIPKYVDQK